ncbi:MAG: hypothetical protein ACJ79S_07300, partial [Gemmatimonadaceae bacterium]
MSEPESPTGRRRLTAALAIGLAAAAYAAYLSARMPSDWVTDFDPVWAGARALAGGANPYALPPAALHNSRGLFYPIPALVAALPLAWLPLHAARAAFAGATAALCAWALFRRGWTLWPLFVSMAFVQTVVLVQWAPLLIFAALTPSCAGLLLAKPHMGAPLGFCEYVLPGVPDRRRLAAASVSGVAMLAASFSLFPGWVGEWLQAIHDSRHMTPALLRWQAGGPLLLLALLRWRQPEARLLVALAAVPQTPGVLEGVALFLVTRTVREALWLAVLSYVAYIVGGLAWWDEARFIGVYLSRELAYYRAVGVAALWLLYVPCLVMVLRRPNNGALPARLEGTVARD